jgi:hypothetical protein
LPRIIVVDDAVDPDVFMDETVTPEHLDNSHSAGQLLERLTWAVQDAQQRRRGADKVRAITPYGRMHGT